MENETDIKPKSKWFWLGIILGFVAAPLPGIIYGAVLFSEKEYRRDAIIIIVWAIVYFTISAFLIGPWLREMGYLPSVQIKWD